MSGTFSSAWTALKDLWEGPISEGIETIKGALSTFFEEIIKPLGQFIGHAMLEAWTKLKDYWENDLSPKLAALHEAFKTFKDNVLSPMAKTVRNTLLQAWEKISAFFAGDANESTKTLSGTLRSLWNNVLKPVAEFVSGTLSVAFDTFTKALSGLIEFLTNVFEGDWEGAWNTVVETFGGIWSAIVDYVKTPINAAIGLVNDMINWINDRMKGIAEKIQIPAFTVGLARLDLMAGNFLIHRLKSTQSLNLPKELSSHRMHLLPRFSVTRNVGQTSRRRWIPSSRPWPRL